MPDDHQLDAFSEVDPSDQETIARKIDLPADLLEANSPGGEISPPESSLQDGASWNKTLLFGGIGCVLLLCVGLFGAIGLLTAGNIFWEASNDKTAAAVTTEPTPSKLTNSKNETRSPTKSRSGDLVLPTHQSDITTVAGTPEMSKIEFSLKTDPTQAHDSFETGVVTILATFEYHNLSADNAWTQIWYHDGQEISRSTQPWLEGESGIYEYVIETGQGPLPEGRWKIEFYINGNLVTSGSFEITADGQASQR
ncbi:MAG: hypothetical protein KDI79_06050 [Anaerolineae bacterium]|nr:hypothetical protein [Anaerolineae bacterium]